MFRKFIRTFPIVFSVLFLMDWFLGVLKFYVRAAQTVFEMLNVPFGIIALRLERTVPPMTDTPIAEVLAPPVFFIMVFLQALLYTAVFLLAKYLLSKDKVRIALRRIPH